ISSATALYKLDLEQFRADPERLSKLHQPPLLGGSSGSSQSGEWPQWRGPNRDGLSLETGLIRSWPKDGPPLRWQRFVGRGFSAPVIAQGRVYTMAQNDRPEGPDIPAPATAEAVICWNADSGKELWRFCYANRYEERMGSGPRSTPAVDGDFIYAVGPTGIFHCLRADTGEKVWRHDLLEEF